MQALPSASLSEIETYRTYLETRNPIAEIETRFLDPADDLVCRVPKTFPSLFLPCSLRGYTHSHAAEDYFW